MEAPEQQRYCTLHDKPDQESRHVPEAFDPSEARCVGCISEPESDAQTHLPFALAASGARDLGVAVQIPDRAVGI